MSFRCRTCDDLFLWLRAAFFVLICLVPAVAANAQTAALTGAGYATTYLPAVAPGQVVTLTVYGLKGPLPESVSASTVPLPSWLIGISISARQTAASTMPIPVPLFSIERLGDHTAAITVQIPFELVPAASWYWPGWEITDPTLRAELVVSDNGMDGERVSVVVVPNSVHVATLCDTTIPRLTRQALTTAPSCPPLVTHADGTLVSSASPAHPEEVVVVYLYGLGKTNPVVASGAGSPSPAAGVTQAGFDVQYLPPISESGAVGAIVINPLGVPQRPPIFAGLTPGLVGLYQMNLKIPAPSDAIRNCAGGGASMVLIVGGTTSVDLASICVQGAQ